MIVRQTDEPTRDLFILSLGFSSTHIRRRRRFSSASSLILDINRGINVPELGILLLERRRADSQLPL